MIDDLSGFDWDVANVAHVMRHDVLPNEVEEAFSGLRVMLPAKTVKGEARWKLFGKTASGRYLTVVFTVRRNLYRVITAHDMNAADRRIYASQID